MNLELYKTKKSICGVYEIVNIVTGHRYIGSSIYLNRRKNDHFSFLARNRNDNKNLQNAYNIYGKNNFIFKVLLYCEPFERFRYEQFFVDKLDPEYNIYKECVTSNKGRKLSEETKRKIRMNHADFSGSNHPRFGKKLSDDTKRKISEAHKKCNRVAANGY